MLGVCADWFVDGAPDAQIRALFSLGEGLLRIDYVHVRDGSRFT